MNWRPAKGGTYLGLRYIKAGDVKAPFYLDAPRVLWPDVPSDQAFHKFQEGRLFTMNLRVGFNDCMPRCSRLRLVPLAVDPDTDYAASKAAGRDLGKDEIDTAAHLAWLLSYGKKDAAAGEAK